MEQQKISTKEIIIGVVAVLLLIGVGVFYYLKSSKVEEITPVENVGLSAEEKASIEARINSAPVKELTEEEKSSIEERINSAPVKELTPEEKAAIEARINQ